MTHKSVKLLCHCNTEEIELLAQPEVLASSALCEVEGGQWSGQL